jgi:hypothetical protein
MLMRCGTFAPAIGLASGNNLPNTPAAGWLDWSCAARHCSRHGEVDGRVDDSVVFSGRITMKQIATKVLFATVLAASACGVAQAHTGLNIGIGLGIPGPVYEQPAPVYAPQPYYAAQPAYIQEGWGWRDHRGDWGHRGGYRDYRGHGDYGRHG